MKLIQARDRRLLFKATVPLIFRCACAIRRVVEGRKPPPPKLENNDSNFSVVPSAAERGLPVYNLHDVKFY